MENLDKFEQKLQDVDIDTLRNEYRILWAQRLPSENTSGLPSVNYNSEKLDEELDWIQSTGDVPDIAVDRLEIQPTDEARFRNTVGILMTMIESAYSTSRKGRKTLSSFYGQKEPAALELSLGDQEEAPFSNLVVYKRSPLSDLTKYQLHVRTQDHKLLVLQFSDQHYGFEVLEKESDNLPQAFTNTAFEYESLASKVPLISDMNYRGLVNPKTGFGFDTYQNTEALDTTKSRRRSAAKLLAGLTILYSPHAFYNADTSPYLPYPIELIDDLNHQAEHQATGIKEPLTAATVITSHESEPVLVPQLPIDESIKNAPSKYSNQSNVIGQEGVWKVTAGIIEARNDRFIEECLVVKAEKGENFAENEVRVFVDDESDVSLDVHTHGPVTLHVCTLDESPVRQGTDVYFSVADIAEKN